MAISDSDFLSINQDQLNPISKILFALAWKQGDLQKLKQIIKGIDEAENPNNEKEEPIVFYCFGNHLGNPSNPMIDQHVIRAFNLFSDNSNFNFVRKSDKVKQCDRKNYHEWVENLKNKSADFLYYLDRILFEIGKIVKLK